MTQNAFKSEKKGMREMGRDEKGRYLKGHRMPGPGRPPGSVSITSKIKQMLEEVPPGEKMTRLEAIAIRIFIMAINEGNEQIIKLIWNYVDGMPKESIEMKGEIEYREEDKIIDLLKNADKETRKKIIGGFIEALEKGRREDSL